MAEDYVDEALAGWHRELPELDPAPIAVSERIARLAVLLERELRATLSSHSLNTGELDVLAVLRRSGPPYRLTPTALKVMLLVSSGGMTKRLTALERAGLIRRNVNPVDRRSNAVELTEAGRELAGRVVESKFRAERRLLGGIRKRQRRELAAALRDLCISLGDGAPRDLAQITGNRRARW